MPIAPVFPGPSTGGDSGASFYDATFTGPINLTDGTWTLNDPDSLIQSITYSAGVHTVTWNTTATDATAQGFLARISRSVRISCGIKLVCSSLSARPCRHSP